MNINSKTLILILWTTLHLCIQGLERDPESRPFEPLRAKINAEGKRTYDFFENLQSMDNDDITREVQQALETCQYFCPYDSNLPAGKSLLPVPSWISQRYCLTPKEFESGENIECNKEVEPLIVPEPTGYTSICLSKISRRKPHISGRLYTFVHMTCDFSNPLKPEVEYSKIYSFCFNESTGEVLYTRHRIWKPKLLEYIDVLEELANYTSSKYSTEGYGIFFKQEFETMAAKYQSGEEYSLFSLYMLVPPEDLAFSHWKKAAYHFANVRSIVKENFDIEENINRRIREKAIKMNIEFEINTGLFPVEINNREEFVWIKMVLDDVSERKSGITVMIFDDDYVLNDHKLCDDKSCLSNEEEDENQNKRLKCCTVTRRHARFFGIEQEQWQFEFMDL